MESGLNGRIMLLTKQLDPDPKGGRELLCKLNYDVLKSLCGEDLVLFEIPPGRLYGWRAHLSAFSG